MTGFIPNEAIRARAILLSLGVEPLPQPAAPPQPPPPPIPAIWRALAERVIEFEHGNERVLCWLLWRIEGAIRDAGIWYWIDKSDPDILIGYAVHSCRRYMSGLTAEEHYELERWIDFVPDAYAAAEAHSDAWNAQRAKWKAAAEKGAETRRRNREARAAAGKDATQ